MLLDRLDHISRMECFLDPDRLTLVGLSGGPDSLSLLDGLRRLGYRLAAAYFHHGLRPEADQEAGQLAEWLLSWGIPFLTERTDVGEIARREHYSIEEAARKLRYQFLFNMAQQTGAQAVAVGHTADDQVESVLMHFIQGAGLSGLKGMDFQTRSHGWDANIPLVRPLLTFWKSETLAYCQEYELHPFIDLTNTNPVYFRNRLRVEIIPALEALNPGFRQAVERMAKSLSADDAYIREKIDAAWPVCCIKQNHTALILSRQALLAQPLSLQRGVIRRAFMALAEDTRNLGFEIVEQTLGWISKPPRKGQANLAGNLRILLQSDQIILARWDAELPGWEWPQLPLSSHLAITAPGNYIIGNGWRLQITLQPAREAQSTVAAGFENPFVAFLNGDRLAWPLEIRARQPGDRFKPFGMGGQQIKLADFWINEKLPHRARALWPLVFSGFEIAWVPGFRPGENFRVTAETRQVARFCLSHEGE